MDEKGKEKKGKKGKEKKRKERFEYASIRVFDVVEVRVVGGAA